MLTTSWVVDMCVHVFMIDIAQSAHEVTKITKPNGEIWCYHAAERAVHRKGFSEETKGSGASRACSDQDFESMCDQLKSCGWEFSLNDKEEKQLDKGKLPAKLTNKLKLADNVRDSFVIDRVIVILVHSKLSHDIIFGRCKLVVHFLVLQLFNFVACECRLKLNDVMSYVAG